MENLKDFNRLKIFFAGMSVSMIVLVIITSLKSNLLEALPVLNQQPWFVTTIVDFYFNIAIISAWMIYKERGAVRRLLWLTAFILLGSIATAFYVVMQIIRAKVEDGFAGILLRKSSA